jgi:hypothetical protein
MSERDKTIERLTKAAPPPKEAPAPKPKAKAGEEAPAPKPQAKAGEEVAPAPKPKAKEGGGGEETPPPPPEEFFEISSHDADEGDKFQSISTSKRFGKYQDLKKSIDFKLHLDKFDNLQKYNENLRWNKYKSQLII